MTWFDVLFFGGLIVGPFALGAFVDWLSRFWEPRPPAPLLLEDTDDVCPPAAPRRLMPERAPLDIGQLRQFDRLARSYKRRGEVAPDVTYHQQ